MLTGFLAAEFEEGVRRRGEVYAARGLVRRLSVSRHDISAEVHGTEIYDVNIDLESTRGAWRIVAGCTCPYAEAAPCKHIWATLVRADDRVAAKWGSPPNRVRLVLETPGLETDWDELEEAPVSLSPRARRDTAGRPIANTRGRRPKTPGWRRLLDAVPPYYGYAERAAPRAPLGPLHYILDAERSRLNGVFTLALGQADAGRPKAKRIAITPELVPLLTDAKDRAVCATLVGAARPGRESVYSLGRNHSPSSLWQLDHDLFPLVVPMLFDTGRFCWSPGENVPPRPLRAESEAWELMVPSAGGESRIGSRQCRAHSAARMSRYIW